MAEAASARTTSLKSDLPKLKEKYCARRERPDLQIRETIWLYPNLPFMVGNLEKTAMSAVLDRMLRRVAEAFGWVRVQR